MTAPTARLDDAPDDRHSVTDAAIELIDVTKRFGKPGEDSALTDLTLRIADGELVCLVGPSGCGKTTTLRLINRLETPTSGQVLVHGRPVDSLPTHELRRGIGYVIQQVGLFPHRRVFDNIATVPRLLGWSSDRVRTRVEELCELVSLDRRILRRYPSELSGGQQQRVGVARALAVDPPILLMDEPYSAVDPIVRTGLQAELRAIHERLRTTIVFVTHDIDEAMVLADRIALFGPGGHLVQFGPPAELLSNPADDFVVEFCGRRKSLRLLSLRTVGSLQLRAASGEEPIEVSASDVALDALDALLASGAGAARVIDSDGSVLGSLHLIDLPSVDAPSVDAPPAER